MRYVLVIADGSALAGAGEDLYSALDAAETPALDAMGRLGKVGTAATAVAGWSSFARGALALLGGEAAADVSDAVVDAAGDGVPFAPGDAAVRAELVRVSPDDADGLMLGPSDAGVAEARALFDDLVDHWAEAGWLEDGAVVGEGADRILIVRPDDGRPRFAGVETEAPSSIAGTRWIEHLPDGGHASDSSYLCGLVSASRHFLADHPINAARGEQGLDPVNLAWVWGAGNAPSRDAGVSLPDVTPAWFVDDGFVAGRGLCRLLGVEHEERGADAESVLASGAPLAVWLTRRPIDELDERVAAPLLSGLAGDAVGGITDTDDAGWRLLVAVSHDPMGLAGSGGGLAPFALAGGRVRSVVDRRLSGAVGSDLRVDPASDLLEYVLRSGLRGVV